MSPSTRVIVEAAVKIVVLIGGLMTAAAYLVLLERKMAAWIQDRRGPNRVGIPLTKLKLGGLGQPLADGLKFIFKEEYVPEHVDKPLYKLAPLTIMAAALAGFAVIPFGSFIPWGDETIPLVVAPGIDVGIIYIFALGSLAVYGVVLGGWATNNKYSFLGGLRSSAQLIAYEIPLSLGILGVVLVSGTLRLDTIIETQAQQGWNVLFQPLGFFVFLVAAFAESARLPFDLPECEQELIGGYHTEYAGMRLLLYLIAEFLHMVTASFLIVILFFGGWHFWGLTGYENEATWLQAILRIAVLGVKIMAVILFFMMVRWSWPRFRFDQLMALAWKVMLPLGLINFVLVAVAVEFQEPLDATLGRSGVAAVMWALMVVSFVLMAIAAPMRNSNRPRIESYSA